MKRLTTMLLCFAVALLGTVSVASAEVVHNSFWADMDTSTNTITGSSVPFYEYPQPDGSPTWSNAWFFNSPEIKGWKWIEYFMELRNTGEMEVEVAINWSDPNWTDASRPPTDAAEDPFIVRETIWLGSLESGLNILENPGQPIIIPDYNPIWVSFDVRAFDGSIGELQMDVQLWHEHVPEPATMALLGIGGLAILRRRRRA